MVKKFLKQKIVNKRAGIYSLLFIFLFQLAFGLITVISPQKAFADAKFNEDISKFFKLQAFSKCIEGEVNVLPNPNLPPPAGRGLSTTPTVNNFAGLSEYIIRGSQSPLGYFDGSAPTPVIEDINYWIPSELGISVSYSVANDDGKWICGYPGHFEEWVKLIGYKSWRDWRDSYYGSTDDYDNTLKLKVSRGTAIREVRAKINDNMPNLSDAQKYVNYLRSFRKCTGPAQTSSNDVSDPWLEITGFVGEDGKETTGVSYFSITNERFWPGTDELSVGHGVGPADGRLTCQELAGKLTSLKGAYVKYIADNPTEEPPGLNPQGGASLADDNSCEAKGGILSWVMCPVTEILSGILNWIDTQLIRLLEVDRTKYASEGLYIAWSSFRNIALSLLLITMIMMVAGTAIGIGALDAYTVKKAMPRMVAAVIFILLSWYICLTLIEISNVVGRGLLGLMTSPFGGKAASLQNLFDPNAAGTTLQFGGLALIGVAAFSQGFLALLMSWVGTALLIMGIAFLTLVARQMFIIVLVLFAPIAILTWIFPGNDKPWKFWWQSFSKLLIMFPMVMALIASGRIFAGVISLTPVSGGEGIMNTLLKLTAYVVPYAFIPFTFKVAGGAFGNVTGMLNDRSKGAFDRLKKSRSKTYGTMANNARTGNLTHGRENFLDRGARRLSHANKAGFRPKNWSRNIDTAMGTTLAAEIAQKEKEDQDYAQWSGNDGLNRLASESTDEASLRAAMLQARRDGTYHADDIEMEKDIARVEKLRRSTSAKAFRVMTTHAAIKGGTAYGSQHEAWAAVAAAAGNDEALLATMTARARSDMMGAGKVDQGGAGFGDTMGLTKALASGAITEQEFDIQMSEKVLEAQGPGVLTHPSMKPSAVKALIPGMKRRLEAAAARTQATGDQSHMDRELAIMSSIHDSLSQSAPQLARQIGDVMLEPSPLQTVREVKDAFGNVTGTLPPETILDQVKGRAGSAVFQSTHKEYSQIDPNAPGRGPAPGPGGPTSTPPGAPLHP